MRRATEPVRAAPSGQHRGPDRAAGVGILVLALCPCLAASGREPAPRGTWRHAGWGGGGFYWCCAWHPADGDVIYLGGDVAGAYRTEDKGRHWRLINKGLVNYAVHSMATCRSDPEVLYAVTKGGVCRSGDGGRSWEFLEETGKDGLDITVHRPLSVRAVAVDPSDSDVVYAGSRHGRIYKTEDGGKTWRRLDYLARRKAGTAAAGRPAGEKEKGVISSLAVADTDPRLVLATSSVFGVLRSDDGGASWSRPATPKNASCVAVSPSDDGIVYASFWKQGVMKSTDGGRTWADAGAGIHDDCEIREVAVNPENPDVVFCIGNIGWNGYLYKSTDGAATWTRSSRQIEGDLDTDPTLPAEPRVMSKLSNICISRSNPSDVFVAANWRSFLSVDGGRTWTERMKGADISCVQDIQFSGGKTYAVAMDEGLLVSDDRGATWRQLAPLRYSPETSGHQWRVRVLRQGGTERIVSTLSPWSAKKHPNRVLLSEDGGASFEVVTQGLPTYLPSVNCMWGRGYPRALAVDPADPRVMYLGIDGDPEPEKGRAGGGVFKSVDGGRTWKRLAAQPGSRRMFFGLAVDPTDSARVYWGACGEGGGLYRSEDGGESWEHVFANETWLFNVAVSPTGVVYCPGRNLWRSADRGLTWERISDFTDGRNIVGIAIDPLLAPLLAPPVAPEDKPSDEQRIWISRVTWGEQAKGGVYRTTDGGATWEDITGDLPYRKPIVLRFNPETRELWAGGVGLFKIDQ